MDINSSQCLKTASNFFFVLILFFPGIVQAMNFQKITQNLPNTFQSEKEKIFSIFEDLGIRKPKNLSENEVRELLRAWGDPIRLIENSPDGSFGSNFTGHVSPRRVHINRSFFFARFDLHKNSNALFTQLFFRESRGKYEELPFQEAKRNWENFLRALRVADKSGYARFTETDLEAAAISFVHLRFPDRYLPSVDLPFAHSSRSWTRLWEEESLGMYFHNHFNIGHYISPHFTLTSQDHYYILIMNMIWKLSFLRQGENLSLINSKEFVLKIWSDVTKEISRERVRGISNSAFLELISNSIIEFRRSGSGSHPFLEAMEEAARENDRLAKVVDIVNRFATDTSGNLENYRSHILRQFIEGSELGEDTIYNLLSHYGLL